MRREARRDGGVKRTLTGKGTVSTNDGRTVQVTITYLDFLAGTARPASYVTTTVVDVRRARPVLLSMVIQNPADGLRSLGTEVARVARKKGDQVDAEGLAPRVANFANWQSSPAGLDLPLPRVPAGGCRASLVHGALVAGPVGAVGVRGEAAGLAPELSASVLSGCSASK